MAPEQHQPPSLEHGRYVYCVVDASGRDLAASTPTLDVTGLEDEPVRLMPIESDARNESRESSEPTPAAVVHDCTDVYDTDDMRQIKRWVVNHQRVIDAAGDQFGTPLPFQFHTILRGTDDAVRHWLREQQQLLIDALESIAGRWEYRIDVIEREPPSRETLLARDPELAALQSQAAEASEGRAFLLEKQVEQGCKRLRKSRHTAVRDELQSTLADHADAVHELERRPGVDLGGVFETDEMSDGDSICRFSVLADDDAASTIGTALDEVAAKPGLEVRFTGPWPPFSFAPTFDEEGPA